MTCPVAIAFRAAAQLDDEEHYKFLRKFKPAPAAHRGFPASTMPANASA